MKCGNTICAFKNPLDDCVYPLSSTTHYEICVHYIPHPTTIPITPKTPIEQVEPAQLDSLLNELRNTLRNQSTQITNLQLTNSSLQAEITRLKQIYINECNYHNQDIIKYDKQIEQLEQEILNLTHKPINSHERLDV